MRFLISLIIAAVISTGLGIWVWNVNTDELDVVSETRFSGRIYLEDDEYTEFKKELAARPELVIEEILVLSSPNALINFKIIAEGDTDFNYGEKVCTYVDCIEGAIIFVIFIAMLSFGLMFAISMGIITAYKKAEKLS